MDRALPLVSTIVPSFHRPQLVCEAVRSALAQTLEAIEVIVVVDGRDDATTEALGRINDSRLRVLVPERSLGSSGARKAGVSQARGRWVAFLDDDDAWMPHKLAAQLRTAERSAYRYPIVSCRMISRNERDVFLWPRRYPRLDEPISEYVFCRRTPFTGEGIVQTSTIFTPRELLERVPFPSETRHYDDLEWLLRACTVDGAGLEFVPEHEPLSVWNMEYGRTRESNHADWEYALTWARSCRHLFTRRAYASFLMTIVSARAANCVAWEAFLPLAREAWRQGDPSAIDVLTHLANFALPDRVQRQLAASFARRARHRWRGAGPSAAAPGSES